MIRRTIGRLMREPILHFAFGAMLLFALERLVSGPQGDVIVADREALLAMLQARAGRFDRHFAEAALDAMSDGERDAAVRQLVREEALYREALALGLHEEDYVLRRRLAQNVELLLRGLAAASARVDGLAIEARYEARREAFRLPPTRTITHRFFDVPGGETSAWTDAEARARTALRALRAGEPGEPGDVFHAGARFEGVSEATLRGHFGEGIAERLFADAPSPRWRGPFRSSFGVHLFRVDAEQPGRLPPLEEVRATLEAELRAEAEQEKGEAAIQRVLAEYVVRVDPSP